MALFSRELLVLQVEYARSKAALAIESIIEKVAVRGAERRTHRMTLESVQTSNGDGTTRGGETLAENQAAMRVMY